jgi:enoyl-CoA hydratase
LSTDHTRFERRGAVATLTFNRPEARNAMTWDMYQSLVDACNRVDEDPEIRVLILRGAGDRAFIAGTDISQFESFHTKADALAYERRLDEVVGRLESVRKVTIAEVHGVAAGGGCAIALTCDLRIATPAATFGIPIARTLGNCLSAANYARLLDLLGPSVTKDLLMSGRFMDAAEAHARGIVTRIEPADAIAHATAEYAGRIASNAPLTLYATKELVHRVAVARRLPAGADEDVITMCYTSNDFREGVAAFLEKRKPKWTGT